jgi:hypothetical protein
MSKSFLSSLSVAALGGAMLVLEASPAPAFTLYGASAQPVAAGQFDKVYYRGVYRGGYRRGYGYRGGYGYHGGYAYRRGYGYRGGYGYRYGYGGYGYHPYGWGGAAAVGAAAVGAAAVGAAVAAPHCWINAYGAQVCN